MPHIRVNVYMTLNTDDYAEGWSSDPAELEASIKATLHELNGDDGGAYVPNVLGCDIEADEPDVPA